MYNRYHDIEKFITDPDQLQITNGSEVYISSEENHNIVVDLQGHTEAWEQQKPFLVLVARSLCELDNMAQKFDNLYYKSSRFPYVVSIIFLDFPFVILEYWGTEENTQFDVVFSYQEGKFLLTHFGSILDIPSDWEQTLSIERNPKKHAPKRGFFRK